MQNPEKSVRSSDRPRGFVDSISNCSKSIPSLRSRFRHALRQVLLGSLVVSSLVTSVSCTRAKYRYKTNREAYYLIDEKIADSAESPIKPYRIEVDSRSRFFDPFNPDRPPMPEDDPVANSYLRMVDRKKGYPLWEANGRTNTTENPEWWSYLPLDERGVLVMDINQAVRLALLHSPQYQQAMETLFLSALDVSSERFLFDSQFYGGWQTNYTADGPRRRGAGGNSSSTLTTGPSSRAPRGLVMTKQFSTGADLLVGMANTMTWQLAGPNNQSSNTLLDFSLIQPLLAQGGRDVILERLTLSERQLLSNIRAFERYRRSFYMQVVTGRNLTSAPTRRGGVAGGAGLTGFTGLGGGFGTLGGGAGGGNQGFNANATPGAGGYLNLLQQQLTIINTRENIIRQQDNLMRLEDTYRELLLTIPDVQTTISTQQLQVAQQQQSIFSIQTNLLATTVSYEQTMDAFKQTLGLPPYLCIEIRDPLLERFNLISPELRARRDNLSILRGEFGVINTAILDLSQTDRDPDTNELYRTIDNSAELTVQLKALRETIKPLKEMELQIVNEDIVEVRADIQRLREAIPTRLRQMERLRNIVDSERDMVCSLIPLKDFDTRVLDSKSLGDLPDVLVADLDRLEVKFKKNADKSLVLDGEIEAVTQEIENEQTGRNRFEAVSQKAVLGTQDLIAVMAEDLLAVQLIQARARTESALLPEVDIEPREALEIARRNRRDWLNNRNAIVNTWRAIEFVADDLESFLDLAFSGDVQNVGDNPLALRSSTGRLRVGLVWDAPITRLQERNRYRQALIEYQQAKRSYYQFEDSVWQGLRTSLRSIRQNQLSFELQRYAVRNAAQQVSINEDLRLINETLNQASGPTAARDTVTALSDLLSSQNLLIGVWVNYEALRRSLDLDLGTMQIDSEGLWIDPVIIRPDTVGGQLGEAILNYGLTESEQAASKQVQEMTNLPIEFATMNHTPIDALYTHDPNADHQTQTASHETAFVPHSRPVLKNNAAAESFPDLGLFQLPSVPNSAALASPPTDSLNR